ncbi:unnamed protein product [Bemisia tabaci]|uniref:Lines n=1 Tax=Bemisia tabaci TaxID=7038 RepID=A0A9N9ZZ60_BEMTA|nr:unnamed protein product [Bemisia tabaci]
MVIKKGNTPPKLAPVMEEPAKKKPKFEGGDGSSNQDLEILQENLLNECLCGISEANLRKSFRGMGADGEDSGEYWTTAVAKWSRDRVLQFVSCIQLVCEIAIKQNSRGLLCSRIGDVCDVLVRNEEGLVDQLIELSSHNDPFICFAAGRALSALFLLGKTNIDQLWLDRLTDNILYSTPNSMAFSLDAIKRVIEWKDEEEHPLEVRRPDDRPVANCRLISITDPDCTDSSPVKCLCIKALELKWPAIVTRFENLIASHDSKSEESTIVTFLDLWEAIISVKANLSVSDTKPFYSHLNQFLLILNSRVGPVIWKHTLSLFNEVLCYGSTLALQDILAEEPCGLAHLIVRSIKDWRLLESLPYRGGSGRFGGGSGDGNKPLLQKMVLLVLKAVAVTVKETRCESSSDSSLGSEAEDADADMAVIERSIKEVLRQLDNCVKTLLPFHPETPLAQWVVHLFSDQDDALVEGMVCCLDVATGLCYRPGASLDLRHSLSPSVTFVQFLRTVSHDPDVLLDLLISNETCFLLYLLRLLKFVRHNRSDFIMQCGFDVDSTMKVFKDLRSAIDRLVAKDLFPYNINPVLRLLQQCEQV